MNSVGSEEDFYRILPSGLIFTDGPLITPPLRLEEGERVLSSYSATVLRRQSSPSHFTRVGGIVSTGLVTLSLRSKLQVLIKKFKKRKRGQNKWT